MGRESGIYMNVLEKKEEAECWSLKEAIVGMCDSLLDLYIHEETGCYAYRVIFFCDKLPYNSEISIVSFFCCS